MSVDNSVTLAFRDLTFVSVSAESDSAPVAVRSHVFDFQRETLSVRLAEAKDRARVWKY